MNKNLFPIKNKSLLPRVEDSISFLYFEHSRIRQLGKSIQVINKKGITQIPVASLCCLLLGPGTSITHEAIKNCADVGCSISWVGEGTIRYYAQGIGETYKSDKIIKQAQFFVDENKRLEIAKRMYQIRFNTDLPKDITIEKLRGMEGARVKNLYHKYSIKFNIPWKKRRYTADAIDKFGQVNQCLNIAHYCLYSICHAAIVSSGYSPSIGFVHKGHQLSFVYDIADLYKSSITIPISFFIVGNNCSEHIEEVYRRCRIAFHETNLLKYIIDDINILFDLEAPIRKNKFEFIETFSEINSYWQG